MKIARVGSPTIPVHNTTLVGGTTVGPGSGNPGDVPIDNGDGTGTWGPITAAIVTYSNSASGLTADDVQEAIDELAASSGAGGEDTSLVTVAATGTTETIDCSVARTYDLALNANCTFTLAGAVDDETHFLTLLLRESGAGGWTITWPASVTWKGTPITVTTADMQIVNLLTIDGGVTWIASAGGSSTVTLGATVVSETAFGLSPTAGVLATASRSDHTHGTPGDPALLIPVDVGTPTYDDTGVDMEVAVATVWGVDGADPYYDSAGAVAGEEAALYWDSINATYLLVTYDF